MFASGVSRKGSRRHWSAASRPTASRAKLDGAAEAKLVALACSEPPEGHAPRTLKLLGERLVALEIVDSIGTETVRRTLKKTM